MMKAPMVTATFHGSRPVSVRTSRSVAPSLETQPMHRAECEIETEQHQPEMDLPERSFMARPVSLGNQ